MATNESFQLYMRLLKQRHVSLINASEALLMVLPADDPDQKKTVAADMLQAAIDLRAMLSPPDVPSWLKNLNQYLSRYVEGRFTGYEMLTHFISVQEPLRTHCWAPEENAEVAFDFDAIFERFKKESRLPDLFDQIVRALEEIQSSGAVDSVTMLSSLGRVIATIKRCKDGSYFSLNSGWEFLLSFLNNYLWGELAKLPVLGTALEALGQAIRETNDEMFKVHNQVKEEMNRSVEAGVNGLANKSAFPFLSYNKDGHLLSGSSACQLPDTTA